MVVSEMKIGRNDPCTCGSGKKFKDCHGHGAKSKTYRLAEVKRLLPKLKQMQAELQPQRLSTRPVLMTEHKDKVLRGVGSEIFACAPEESFYRFLIDFLFYKLGTGWYEQEMAKPASDRHIIVTWYRDLMDQVEKAFEEGKRDFGKVPLTGSLNTLLVLADDICQLAHALTTPRKILDRLRNFKEFQGARYEIMAASVMARCGFKISFIDDSSRKQPEFVAKSETLLDEVLVEVKSRRREGVLHESGAVNEPTQKGDLRRLFNKAVAKAPGNAPFLIFIDLNRTVMPFVPYSEKEWFQDVNAMLKRWDEEKPAQLKQVSGLVVTNFSWHYHREANAPYVEYAGFPFEGCDYPLQPETWKILGRALSEYGVVPDEEEHQRSVRARYPELS